MAIVNTNILVKRSSSTAAPGALLAGELAYSYVSNTAFIGTADGNGVLKIGGQAYTSAIDNATTSNTASTIVKRDASGKFSGSLVGNADTSTKLAAAVNINGAAFDGSQAITINAVDSTARVASSLLGANSGVATLDSSGKLSTSQIPAALVGALQYQGVWNANTNTPTIVTSTGIKGQYYKVSVAGITSIDSIAQWNVGDMIVFDGTTWDKIDGLSTEVVSVAGKVGAVVLTSFDVGLGAVSNTAQVTAISATGPLVSTGTTTPTISMTTANTSVSGYLTSTDWNTFNNKVSTFSGGTTGLTPSTATKGAITLGGTLVVANGGTGLSTITQNGITFGNGTGNLGVTAAAGASDQGFSNQILTVNASGTPVWTNNLDGGTF